MLAIRTLAASAALSVLIAATALAQTPAPGAKAPVPATPPPVAATPAPTAPAPGTAAATTTTTAKKKAVVAKGDRTPESLACSAEADQKNIHGSKERKPFMAKCKAAAKKAAKASAPAAAPPAPAKKS